MKKTSKNIEKKLKQGKFLKVKKDGMNIIIGKGEESLEKFLDGGPRGENARDLFDSGF